MADATYLNSCGVPFAGGHLFLEYDGNCIELINAQLQTADINRDDTGLMITSVVIRADFVSDHDAYDISSEMSEGESGEELVPMIVEPNEFDIIDLD